MSDLTIWHNPRCTKSRQTLALLEERGLTPTIRLYLDDAPSLAELTELQVMLGLPAIDMLRPKEALFKELGLSKTDDDSALLKAASENPKLIERPVVITGGKARLGRPPEAVLDIL